MPSFLLFSSCWRAGALRVPLLLQAVGGETAPARPLHWGLGAEPGPSPGRNSPHSSQFLPVSPGSSPPLAQHAEPFLLPRLTSAWGTRARRWPRPALWHRKCWEMAETMLLSQNIPPGRRMLQDLQEKAARDQLEAQASRPRSSILSNPRSGIYFRVFPHPSSSALPRGLPWAFPFAFPPATTSGELKLPGRRAAGRAHPGSLPHPTLQQSPEAAAWRRRRRRR